MPRLLRVFPWPRPSAAPAAADAGASSGTRPWRMCGPGPASDEGLR